MSDLNQSVFELIFGLSERNAALDSMMVFLAQYLPYLLVLGFLVMAFYRRNWKMRLITLAEGTLAVILARGIITEFIRFFYHNPRPFEALGFTALINESGYSFPSGHAAFLFAIAMVIFYFNRRLGGWYFAFATINGLARIFVGVHWPLDIIGGIAVGILSGLVVHAIVKPFLQQLSQEKLEGV